MQTIGGVFESRTRALETVRALRAAGVDEKRIVLLTPGSDPKEFALEAELLHDSEGPGAWGAVGAGMGSFAGAALVSIVMPGVGPVIGLGMLAAAFIAGGVGGKVAGDAIERSQVHDDVGDDFFLFEDALRRERAMVVVFVDHKTDPKAVDEIVRAAGGMSLDEARAAWWHERREEEERYYASLGSGRRFSQAESAYRRGFEAGLDPRYRGRKFESVAVKLRTRFHDDEEEDFRTGFERAAELGWERQAQAQRDLAAKERAAKAERARDAGRASAPSIH